MYGAQIAFRDYSPVKGFTGSPWVGLKHFIRFFNSYYFLRLLTNTVVISAYSIVAGFPFPILLAVALNYTKNKFANKSVQMITYAPYFISTVVIVGMLMQFLSARTGAVNIALTAMGLKEVNFLGNPAYFRSIYVWSDMWQSVGYHSIIYLAALTGVDPQLHESAIVDGANRFKRVWHIDLPCILPTIVIVEILAFGGMLNIGFEKAYMLQNSMNIATSEIVQTYVYKIALQSQLPNYSYPSAIGLTLSVMNLLILLIFNKLSKKISETALW